MNLQRILNGLLVSAVLAGLLSVTGCSDDDAKPEVTKVSKPAHNPFDHSHDEVITDVIKHKFEHDFADQCVEREAKNSTNLQMDRERFEKPCMCIAQYMMKDLTAQEAEKFLTEHKTAQSLRIKFDNAAFHCLQPSQLPKGPKFTKSEEN